MNCYGAFSSRESPLRSLSIRRATALASALAVGSATFVAAGPAQASLPGQGDVLTTSNGGNVLSFYGSTPATLVNGIDTEMHDAAWSPDGSRAAYVDQDNGISYIRYNDPVDVQFVIDPGLDPAGLKRDSVSWSGTGSGILWAEKESDSARWAVWTAPSYTNGSYYSHQLTPANDGEHYLNPDGGVQGLVVFQRQQDNGSGAPTGQPAVMLYNPASQPATTTLVDDNGSNPAISPDGKKVAFVRGGQIIVSDLTGGSEVVVASSTTNDNPTWSPDGARIAFNSGASVVTALADGSQAGSPSVVPIASGVPAYQPRNKDRAVRLAGSSRFTTATAASQSHWATVGATEDQREQAQAVVLSRSDTFADALSGSALAAAKGGPLLMTPTNSLNVDTANELKRVLAPGGTVYVLGSEGALSATVFNAVKNLGFAPKRLAGSSRFSTSVAIAKEINPSPELVLLATGMNFPDALAAGAAAGSFNGSAVVLLTQDAIMPADTKAFLDTLSANSSSLFGIGRSGYQAASAYAAASGWDVSPVVGANRFETAYGVSYVFFGGHHYAGLATGMDWPDALSGGALMGRLNGPLLLTNGTSAELSPEAAWGLDEGSGSVNTGLIFGSAAVVSSSQHTQMGVWIGGPLGSFLTNNATDVGVNVAPLKAGVSGLRQADASTIRSPKEAAAAAKDLQKQLADR